MKNIFVILGLSITLFSACNSSDKKNEGADAQDTTFVPDAAIKKSIDPIIGKLVLIGDAKLGQPINMKFTVYNNTDTTTKFCIWHTPFEKLMSNYLDVAFEDFSPVDYKGPMAKRIMPPPADSYKKLNAGDSISTNFNLVEGYAIAKSGAYTIKYNSTTISGIAVQDSLKIVVKN